MDNVYCFHADGGNFSVKKNNWRLNIKIKFFPKQQLSVLSWFLFAIFDASMNVASKLLAVTFKVIEVATSAHKFPCKMHIPVSFSPHTHTDLKAADWC